MTGARLSAVLVSLVLIAVGIVSLFFIQNSSRMVELSLDLGPIGAWKLQDPVSVSALIGVCLGTGFALGAGLLGVRMLRLGARVRDLEQQISVAAIQDGVRKDPGAW